MKRYSSFYSLCYVITCLVTRCTLLPLAVLVYPLVVLVCPLIVLVCPPIILVHPLVVLVCPLLVSVCPLIVLVVLSVSLFITDQHFIKYLCYLGFWKFLTFPFNLFGPWFLEKVSHTRYTFFVKNAWHLKPQQGKKKYAPDFLVFSAIKLPSCRTLAFP